jgi:hypothetical protein
VSWEFEIHRGGRGEYELGQSEGFPPLDDTAARKVLVSVPAQVEVDVVGDAESDDEVQWVGEALVVETSLLRGRDGRVRVIGFRFSSTGEARDRYDTEHTALMGAVFDVADRVKGEVYNQEGVPTTRAHYGLAGAAPAPPVTEFVFDFDALSSDDAVGSALEAMPELGLAERSALKDWQLLIELPQDLRSTFLLVLVLQTIEDAWGVDFDTADRLAAEIMEEVDLTGAISATVKDRRFNGLPATLRPLGRAFAARALVRAVVAEPRADEHNARPS